MSTATLLIELGTEELPPKALHALGVAFADGVVNGLNQRDLTLGKFEWFASPRRLAVLISDVPLRGADKDLELLGPPADKAKDADGNWTPAAAGFAKKQGIAPEELAVIDTPKGERLGVKRTEAGVNTALCIEAVINEAIAGLPIPRRMRWGANRVEFVRPVHWVTAMLGEQTLEGEVLGLKYGNTTRGHRFHSAGELTLSKPEEYEVVLSSAKVIAHFDKRRARIVESVNAAADALGAVAVIEEDLLNEVTGLVEWPVALAGSFEERFLEVPAEALISSMKEHQKYFHVVDEEGNLKPYFITVSNIESTDPAQVIAGNERVIRPRLSDAAFFFETDKKTPLADRLVKLEGIVFQKKLGSVADKTRRIASLAKTLATEVGADAASAERAALLSKCDLVTDMVLEFSDMQGVAGAYYAEHDGEAASVAQAIAQQYWPKFAGDQLPEEPVACALGLADRLDTLVGIFGIGQAPTGSKDPFALRRASLAVLRIIVEKGLDLDLHRCVSEAAAGFAHGVLEEGTVDAVFAYMIERFRAWYEEDAIPVEVFKAVTATEPVQPLDIHRRVLAVHAFSQLPEAQALAAANKRVSNILGKLDAGHQFGEVSTNLLAEAEEKGLSKSLEALSKESSRSLSSGDYTAALSALAGLRGPVDAFFDGVMVNADDDALRNNRLNLLKQLRDQFLAVADISQLAVTK
ncbi:MAG: glycine--tRNA ligase subunit beta [Halioglobus sp.]